MSRTISAAHALDEREKRFCKVYAAFGCKQAAEAWRRVYLIRRESDKKYVPRPEGQFKQEDLKELEEVGTRARQKQASALLKREHIRAYIEEITGEAGEAARQVLSDQAKFETGPQARAAADKIIELEDKLGFRDAAEKWAEIMCAIGAEVVVELPGGSEVFFPLREMFPSYRAALPPRDVLEKTVKTLEEMLETGRGVGE